MRQLWQARWCRHSTSSVHRCRKRVLDRHDVGSSRVCTPVSTCIRHSSGALHFSVKLVSTRHDLISSVSCRMQASDRHWPLHILSTPAAAAAPVPPRPAPHPRGHLLLGTGMSPSRRAHSKRSSRRAHSKWSLRRACSKRSSRRARYLRPTPHFTFVMSVAAAIEKSVGEG